MAELEKLLLQPNIRSQFDGCANRILSSRESRTDPEMLWESQDDEDGWRESARRIFEQIVTELDRPAICTVADLAGAFDVNLGIPPEKIALDFDRLKRLMLWNTQQHRRSNPIAVSTGWFSQLPNQKPTQIWTSRSGIRVSLCGSLTQGSPKDRDLDVHPQRVLYLALEGCCTAHALSAACQEVGEIIGALLESFKLLAQASQADCADHTTLLVAMDHPLVQSQIEVCDDSGTLTEEFALLPVCLEACFQLPSKKSDGLNQRIRNAIQLMVEADRQKHHAVGLALTMAAMEALCCNSNQSVVANLSQNIATLFETDASHRESAISAVKRMYDLRSEVLHGTGIEANSDDRRKARLLGAGILKAVLQYRSMRQRMNAPNSPGYFQQDLKDAYENGHRMPGVLESPVKVLWRHHRL